MILLPWDRPLLDVWERRDHPPEVMGEPPPGVFRDRHRRFVAVESPGPPEDGGPYRKLEAAILRYDIFPPSVGHPVVRKVPVKTGDTVGLRYHFLPGIDMFFASRVVDHFIDRDSGQFVRSGFTYRTLVGHPELGEETFQVIKDTQTGAIAVGLHAWSRPNLWFSKLGQPIARAVQWAAGRGALDYLENQVSALDRWP